MKLTIAEATRSLERTPGVLNELVRGLPAELSRATEGGDTWSCYDVVGHLIHGEITDWMPRIRMIVETGESRAFEPFDRAAMFREPERPLSRLLGRFQKVRAENLVALKKMRLRPADMTRTGVHPELGRVTLGQLISTWVVHDFSHVAQISRILAKQFDGEVGPWKAYLGILNR